jgi:hypothetical protein
MTVPICGFSEALLFSGRNIPDCVFIVSFFSGLTMILSPIGLTIVKRIFLQLTFATSFMLTALQSSILAAS